jgi:hypothetical protein
MIPLNTHLPAIHRAINFYHNKLSEMHPTVVLTPNALYQLNDDLQRIRNHQRQTETHHVWNIPVKVIRNPNNAISYMVVEDDASESG